ncbi:collagen alpha-5(IV) chain-like [Penaeus monodon]|uniref:collagen alpha-5(IV) chain-like n=1 Tax=Penaeus monodon TaxID=6687 RepID=UPI0018A74B2B|nr:collagen alpha-5(IV) chain-like [Penaeus monodon]
MGPGPPREAGVSSIHAPGLVPPKPPGVSHLKIGKFGALYPLIPPLLLAFGFSSLSFPLLDPVVGGAPAPSPRKVSDPPSDDPTGLNPENHPEPQNPSWCPTRNPPKPKRGDRKGRGPGGPGLDGDPWPPKACGPFPQIVEGEAPPTGKPGDHKKVPQTPPLFGVTGETLYTYALILPEALGVFQVPKKYGPPPGKTEQPSQNVVSYPRAHKYGVCIKGHKRERKAGHNTKFSKPGPKGAITPWTLGLLSGKEAAPKKGKGPVNAQKHPGPKGKKAGGQKSQILTKGSTPQWIQGKARQPKGDPQAWNIWGFSPRISQSSQIVRSGSIERHAPGDIKAEAFPFPGVHVYGPPETQTQNRGLWVQESKEPGLPIYEIRELSGRPRENAAEMRAMERGKRPPAPQPRGKCTHRDPPAEGPKRMAKSFSAERVAARPGPAEK